LTFKVNVSYFFRNTFKSAFFWLEWVAFRCQCQRLHPISDRIGLHRPHLCNSEWQEMSGVGFESSKWLPPWSLVSRRKRK